MLTRGIAMLLCAAGIAAAVPVTWTLENVQFDDGGTASGFFVFDADTKTVTNWDLVTQGGGGTGMEYTLANSRFITTANFSFFFAASQALSLNFPFSSATNAGGTVNLYESLELTSFGTRSIVFGSATTVKPSALNAGDNLVITFTTVSSTSDILLLQNNDSLTVTGSPTLTTNLYDGQKLLGTHISGPFPHTGGFSFLAAFAAPGGGSGVSLDSPATVDFSSLQNGTINGRLVTSIAGGSISGFYLADTVLVGAKSTGSNSYASMISATADSMTINCPTNLQAAAASYRAAGGTATIQVTAATGCPWTATTSASWIHITTAPGSAGGGSGNGSFSYSVDANTGATRVGAIQAGSQTLNVSQDAAAQCTIGLQASSASLGGGTGTGTFGVAAGAGCSWTATTNDTWIHITAGGTGSGNGTVGYSVDANTGSARTGNIQVGTQVFVVSQAAAGPPLPSITQGGVAEPWTYTHGVAPGAWISIYGSNLASAALAWSPQPNQLLPTTLGGVTVTIGGIFAPLNYVSPTLINALVPAGVELGQISIVVTNQGNASSSYQIQSTHFLPAIYSNAGPGTLPPQFSVTAVDPATGEFLGNASADPRVTRAARAGETVDLYALGLGPATPFITDLDFNGAYALTSTFSVLIGGVAVNPSFVALVAPGLYQVRITIPASTPAGNQSIMLDFGTAQSAQNVSLNIQP